MSQLKIKNGNNWESIPAGGIGVPSGGTTGQVLQKSSNTDYATEWASKGMTLLWTNPNPTSSFAAQTVPLDLSGYDAVFVYAMWSTSYQYVVPPTILPIPFSNARMDSTDTGGVALERDLSVASTGITFTGGKLGTGANNSMIIPYMIYGIKF